MYRRVDVFTAASSVIITFEEKTAGVHLSLQNHFLFNKRFHNSPARFVFLFEFSRSSVALGAKFHIQSPALRLKFYEALSCTFCHAAFSQKKKE